VPGAGLGVPIWLLGSSLFSAQLAAALGLPFAFASHFAPDHLMAALEIYRARFRPSASLAQPYAMAGLTVIAAETGAEAQRCSRPPTAVRQPPARTPRSAQPTCGQHGGVVERRGEGGC
jgi:alkanesulfonate monooxygenase SsuD/methylene tetrahydromethanopterin reductase-like flavin-dependent oxidoreductase (luciferase family)